MAKSKDSFFKREKEKKRLQDRKEKEERKIQRKAEAQKGLGIDSMMAYVDEYGNLSSTPPDPRNKIEIKAEDIQISIPPLSQRTEEERMHKGIVSGFNEEKGYGFIRDLHSNESYFVHVNSLREPIKPGNKVSFLSERGPKGMVAVDVQKLV
ncbi:MAG TPA: cold shock domain-containing protein [Ferruginibacter sp.]|jgi:cold shock CspA family protein|nr:cold shock domain-containing protein [Chitinophagales bacterium]HMU72490.1 cold shock domain-containing protein [Ferruginibacter sp.]HMW25799.1 cold shock domain-containing protein [Ferruginibacter sp.]HNG63345.1 cold shock domain-containing protein [Ferruginibacter sp.]HNK29150.1 cold shock domain-containing protein [Ferruginibacter sp.]